MLGALCLIPGKRRCFTVNGNGKSEKVKEGEHMRHDVRRNAWGNRKSERKNKVTKLSRGSFFRVLDLMLNLKGFNAGYTQSKVP